ncbi:MAG: serine hydrolase [candidate division WOR-3 bacterium]|nr:MAG: serine hydrolase [candidate division WOR-3 bacterium]
MKHIACLILIIAAIAVSPVHAQTVDDSTLVEKTLEYLEKAVTDESFSGTVLIAKDGKLLLKKAYGLANRSFQVPNKIDTKFNLGSMNKMFTGVAVLQLVQKGTLSLQDRIIQHVPDYPNTEIAEKVTIHQLLTHSSGLGHYWTDEFNRASKDRFKKVEDYIPLFADQQLLFEPGTQYSYSNAGFMVLGLIIERVTGEDYFDYVMRNIYEPAGMINTDAYETDCVVPNYAVGYTTFGAEPGTVKNNLFMHVVKGGPAGGGYSTVEDLLSFSNALLGHKLLSPKFTRTVLTGKVDAGTNSRYGYGFRERFENGHRIVGHGGGFPGISSRLNMYVDLGYTVAILSNSDQGSQALKVFIEELLVGKTQYTKNIELTDAVLEHLTEHGYEAGVEYFEKKREGGTVNENTVNRYGYELLSKGNTSGAIAVFRFNVYLYPESSNVYDSLGEAYMAVGDTQLAIENYERSLELDPNNINAVEMLKKLKQK